VVVVTAAAAAAAAAAAVLENITLYPLYKGNQFIMFSQS